MADQFAVTWNGMGFIRWPLLFSFLTVIGFALWSAVRLFRPSATPPWLSPLRRSSTPEPRQDRIAPVGIDAV